MKPAPLLMLASVLALAGCYHMLRQDGEIKVFESPTLTPPHGSNSYRYEINGSIYAGVNLQYLRIPEKHVVVFETEALLDGDQLHVVPTSPGIEEFKVKIVAPGPGVWAFPLGLGSPASDTVSTRVESIQGDVICFVSTMYSYKGRVWRTYLDLKNHTLSQTQPIAP